jgi:hypothetical protein
VKAFRNHSDDGSRPVPEAKRRPDRSAVAGEPRPPEPFRNEDDTAGVAEAFFFGSEEASEDGRNTK